MAHIVVSRRIRDAHQVEVDKIAVRNSQHFQRRAEVAKQERLQAAQRVRDDELRRQRKQTEERARQDAAQQRAAEMFSRHDGAGVGLLGRDELCALLAEALPELGLEPPDATTVDALLRRAQLEGIARAMPTDGGLLGVNRPGVAAIILRYGDFLREQRVLDEAFDKNAAAGGGMDGAGLLALLRELASERDPVAADVQFVLRATGVPSLAAMGVDDCRIERQHMPLLLPAIAAWMRRAPKGAPFEAEPLQGEPVRLISGRHDPSASGSAGGPPQPSPPGSARTESAHCVLL